MSPPRRAEVDRPQADPGRPRRADAARNRAALLAAAGEVVANLGAEAVRVAEVAAAAGVGAGTVYRAFGSKGGLLLALLDERERRLQEELLRGRPPLGPGAPAGERLVAFVVALHELTTEERAVIVASEQGSALAPHRTGAHQAWRLHLSLLIAELRPDADPDVLAELLLATLSASVHAHLLDDLRVPPIRLRRELVRLAELVTGKTC